MSVVSMFSIYMRVTYIVYREYRFHFYAPSCTPISTLISLVSSSTHIV